MARPVSRFIQKLTQKQVQRLEQLRDDGINSRVRHRAHAVLLSSLGTTVKEIVKIFKTNRNTVYSWFDRWESEKFEGLTDKARSGAPAKLNEVQQQRAIELLQETPRSVNTALVNIKEETGVEISKDTLKRLAKKNRLVWKRMRKSLRSKRDQKKFLQHKRELKKLQLEVMCGAHDLFYFDEAGFSLTPSVPYGWQPIGKRIEIPSSKSSQLNVLGFLDYRGKFFDPYVFKGGIDADIVISCMDSFSKKLTRPTTVVIDNAPVHTSAAFQSMIPEWEQKNLFLWFLPAYSPELNLIEILWKKIKYSWLPLDAYLSFEKLDERLCHVLANVGKTFSISFS